MHGGGAYIYSISSTFGPRVTRVSVAGKLTRLLLTFDQKIAMKRNVYPHISTNGAWNRKVA